MADTKDLSSIEGMIPRKILYSDNNIPRTAALFKEIVTSNGDTYAVFTLQKEPGYIKIKDLYLKFCVEDPSEATFALTVFGDIAHWHRIKECEWMKPHLEAWQLHCDTVRKAQAFEAIINEVKTGGRSSFTAAKYLIEEPWKDKRNPATKRKVKETATKAHGTYKDDIKTLKEQGLIN